MSINLRPLHDRVVIKANSETKTESGIIIPDTANEKSQFGEVVAVGTGKDNKALDVKLGDRVLFGKYSGTEIKHEGEDLLVMKEEDIMAVIGS